MLAKLGAVAALSLCLFSVPTAVNARVWETTLRGSSWLYDFDGQNMKRDSQVDSEGGTVQICSEPVIMDEGYYYMMPDSKLYVMKRDLSSGYVEIKNASYESACAVLIAPEPAESD